MATSKRPRWWKPSRSRVSKPSSERQDRCLLCTGRYPCEHGYFGLWECETCRSKHIDHLATEYERILADIGVEGILQALIKGHDTGTIEFRGERISALVAQLCASVENGNQQAETILREAILDDASWEGGRAATGGKLLPAFRTLAERGRQDLQPIIRSSLQQPAMWESEYAHELFFAQWAIDPMKAAFIVGGTDLLLVELRHCVHAAERQIASAALHWIGRVASGTDSAVSMHIGKIRALTRDELLGVAELAQKNKRLASSNDVLLTLTVCHADVVGELFNPPHPGRAVVIDGEISHDLADQVSSQIMELATTPPKTDIALYITSHGGSVAAMMRVLDTIQKVDCNVRTYATGPLYGSGVVLLAAGEPGLRSATPDAQIKVGEAVAGKGGTEEDGTIRVDSLHTLNRQLAQLLSEFADQTYDMVEAVLVAGTSFDAYEAVEFGLIDQVVALGNDLGQRT